MSPRPTIGRGYLGDHRNLRITTPSRNDVWWVTPGGWWNVRFIKIDVRPTDQTLSCAARAHVATAARHDTCLHVRRAMRVACRRDDFDFTRRLGRRAEAGPCQLLRRVRPPRNPRLGSA